MKKLLSLSILGICLFSWQAAACDTDLIREYTPIAERAETGGMLYVADNCKSRASYLFGTLHLDDPRVREAAAPAFKALKKSRRALFEIKNSKQSQQETIAQMVMPPVETRPLSQIIGDQTFLTLSAEVAQVHPGFPNALLERYRPWAASILVQIPPPAADNIHLDDRLQILATELSIPVFGLETPQEQMESFNRMAENEQISLLRDTLDNIDAIRKQNDQLLTLYLKGNLKGIDDLRSTAFNEVRNSKLRGYMRYSLITQRNNKMLKKILPHLARGNSFVAVGAMHLPGTDGLLTQLEEAGYFIWPASVVGAP